VLKEDKELEVTKDQHQQEMGVLQVIEDHKDHHHKEP
jgi:hypothetical protein